jgi:D-alanyl-D-alanine carboxypeptidase/D-alanyl-D-alanine-endopeptidase (penicillin-binding protein 4)
MKAFALLLAVTVILAGCAPSGHLAVGARPLSSTSPYSSVKAGIDALLPDSIFPPAQVGMKIVSLKSGETLYELNPEYLFLPASNEKLLTSAAALGVLGEEYRFATKVSLDTSVSARIYVNGSGDPMLTTADIDSIARQVVPKLPPGKRWTLCADLSFFDDVPWGAGWTWDDEPSTDAMFITPLSANGNGVTVQALPASATGQPPTVIVQPLTSTITVENSAQTVADSVRTPLKITRKWRERSNTITVSGDLLLSAPAAKERLSVWQPEWYTLTLFREALASQGVQCEGLVADTLPGSASELFRFERRLDSVVMYMNKVSDNLSAENLLKTLSAVKVGVPGSGDAGISVVKSFLNASGIDTTKIVLADGSGVSRYNLLSPSAIIRLLVSMYRTPEHFPVWYASLPIAGEDGTLAGRMKGSAAERNLRAKTGTLNGVSNLSGYVSTADGEPLAFSIMMQDSPAGESLLRRAQNRIGAFLAELRRQQF